VFIDETWIKTNMAPLRGWGQKGRRLRGFAPYGHWRPLTFLGALRHDRLVAPCVFDGPINGVCFRAYVEQQLAPPWVFAAAVVLVCCSLHTVRREMEASLDLADEGRVEALPVGVNNEPVAGSMINDPAAGPRFILEEIDNSAQGGRCLDVRSPFFP
jgi:DDE superfamily endonuclease